MRELPILMNGAMVRGAQAPGKSAACLPPCAVPDAMKRRMPSALVAGTPSVYSPADRRDREDGYQADTKHQIHVLPELIALRAGLSWKKEHEHA